MIIKYEYIGDRCIVHIPDNVQWEIVSRSVSDGGHDDNGLYLLIEGLERTLSDADTWCSGRDIPEYEIGALHEDAVDLIAERMAADPNLRLIDIEGIIAELIATKYEKRWLAKGYIEPSADGSW